MPFYEHIPRSRVAAKGAWQVFLWAVFGNDDDGIFWPEVQPGFTGPVTASRLFWKWWWRNKFHNLCFHVLLRRVVDPVYVWPPTLKKWLYDEPDRPVVLRFNPFFVKVGWLYVGWRSDTPMPGAWGGKFDGLPGSGGKFDIGAKDMS